jgi:hypothetical protein
MSCFGPGAADCLLCSPNSGFPYLYANECVAKCPAGTYANLKDCNNLKHKRCDMPYIGNNLEGHDDPAIYSTKVLNGTAAAVKTE